MHLPEPKKNLQFLQSYSFGGVSLFQVSFIQTLLSASEFSSRAVDFLSFEHAFSSKSLQAITHFAVLKGNTNAVYTLSSDNRLQGGKNLTRIRGRKVHELFHTDFVPRKAAELFSANKFHSYVIFSWQTQKPHRI